jgi:phosphoribosylformylglycinamidine synthase
VRRAVTVDLKAAGDRLYVVGETRAELGGSLYHRLLAPGQPGGTPPAPVPAALATFRALHAAIRAGHVRACHDLSEGGLAVAAAEMTIAGRLGLRLDLSPLPRGSDVEDDATALFAESSARFLVEVAPEHATDFEAALAGVPLAHVGEVAAESVLRVRGLGGGDILICDVSDLRVAWQLTEVV